MSFLKPLNTLPKERLLWGFDIETYGKKNKFLMCSIVGDMGIRKSFWEKEDFLRYISTSMKRKEMFNKGYITATNLQFDITGLLYESSMFNNFYPIIRNGKFLLVKIPVDKYRNIKFIDTQSFCYFSVKKWGEILKLAKLPTPKCFMRKPRNSEEEREMEIYNLRDSEITYRAIKLIQQGYNHLGGELKITASASAMDMFRRTAQKEIYFQPKRNLLEYLYKGYYGGRVEVIKRGAVSNLKYYDFNSLYPSVLSDNEFPYPNAFKYSRYINMRTINRYEGVCRVKIKSPKMYIPYLPYRVEKPEKKLIFPVGEFTGYYTFFEIREAIKLGYSVVKFYSGVIYFKKFNPFKDYMSRLYDVRRKQKLNDNPLEIVTKLDMNSLYGKFAQRIDQKDEIIHESNVTFDMIREAQYIDRVGEFFIFKKPYSRIPAFVNPIFSIYTTAFARDKLYKAVCRCRDKIYYYDTDSLMTKKYFETSGRIGELKLEFRINDGILVKPKMYIVNDKVKCKGMGFMERGDFYKLLVEKQRKMIRLAKFKESNRRGLHYNEQLEYYKIVDLEDNKRDWDEKFDAFSCQGSEALVI